MKDKKTKVSSSAKPIKVVLKSLSASSGFFAALIRYPANNTAVPRAAPARVVVTPANTNNFAADRINI